MTDPLSTRCPTCRVPFGEPCRRGIERSHRARINRARSIERTPVHE
ncbi:zinc finger domain-containing protein [Mycolicibacter acidiphilus]